MRWEGSDSVASAQMRMGGRRKELEDSSSRGATEGAEAGGVRGGAQRTRWDVLW